jgi:hypothetical protein
VLEIVARFIVSLLFDSAAVIGPEVVEHWVEPEVVGDESVRELVQRAEPEGNSLWGALIAAQEKEHQRVGEVVEGTESHDDDDCPHAFKRELARLQDCALH